MKETMTFKGGFSFSATKMPGALFFLVILDEENNDI